MSGWRRTTTTTLTCEPPSSRCNSVTANKLTYEIRFSPRDESVRLWYTLWDLFPATYTCPWDMQRIGRLGDGGKWICGMSKYAAHHSPGRPLRLYSFGVGSDSSFEGQFLNESSRAEVWGFDYSVPMWGQGLEGRAANSDRMHFAKVGIASHDYYDDTIKAQLFSIGSIMDKLGHDYVDLIKMDIEGDEFPVLDSFLKEFKGKELPVGQLVIEIHVPEEGLTISQFANWWERLEGSGMRPVWSEANLLAVTVGNEKPCCVEVSLSSC